MERFPFDHLVSRASGARGRRESRPARGGVGVGVGKACLKRPAWYRARAAGRPFALESVPPCIITLTLTSPRPHHTIPSYYCAVYKALTRTYTVRQLHPMSPRPQTRPGLPWPRRRGLQTPMQLDASAAASHAGAAPLIYLLHVSHSACSQPPHALLALK